jgi:Zn ribbon nucleic-acid-binding protein
MNTCIDCGCDYEYDASNPLGASSTRCPKCRKKDSAANKKIILFNEASNSNIMCRKCGYQNNINALVLVDGVERLHKPKTFDQEVANAKTQFILCLNCQAEIKSSEVEFKVTDSKSYPIHVEFYSRHVTVVKEKLKSFNFSSNVIEAEITGDNPETTRVARSPERLAIEGAIDV